ncbi:MAG: response regulator [Thaumarchaeota archaeon]|nr:response regulator [Nitrososphaerota archaeon]
MKFLIIDDNKSIAGMLSQLLELEGYETVVSNDGRNGLTMITEQKFDGVLLDLSMPGFTGLDIIDALEKSGKINEQKIIVLTASTPTDDLMNDLKKRGVHSVLNKPVDVDLLLEILKS